MANLTKLFDKGNKYKSWKPENIFYLFKHLVKFKLVNTISNIIFGKDYSDNKPIETLLN